ncbi:uncharacterized protein TOT_020000981 [Theileria orientalis strain Shintoku]|uniref:SfiI-subtelomeric related protein family member n=1 Tax=Theileria orientalis strain Shintoku TaxID=869250 RepID=J4C3N0_THEOR|nr:uncharacterized protein TOT_020000981 [Theileria orientalis strain Shintoku]BAM40726.1 uncharacterized protein TOT_020000981 [Theileria orientalis strain Shintoku]|eukprot:XP_009691027.1 uncharacterized protein TOT_020000981 [Theileria orientalis strain Shintoku]
MKLCIIFRPLLFYLLLCYGKKFALSTDQAATTTTPQQQPLLYSIEVDIAQRESTSEIIYNVEFDGAETFVCRKGYVIREVWKRDKLLWKYEKDAYPDKVYIITGSDGKRTANVRYPYDELVVEVDLSVKQSNDWVIYQRYDQEDIDLFICKTGYLISKVKKGQAVVWQWQQGLDYPNRVIIHKDEHGKKMATVKFPGDEHILLILDVAVRQSTNEVDYVKDQHGIDAFIPKPGYRIHRVVKNGKFVWECQDGIYPDRINIVYDENGRPIARFKFPDAVPEAAPPVAAPPPEVAPPPPPPPEIKERSGMQLDLMAKEPTQYYNYEDQGNVGTYTPYDTVAFNSIMKKNSTIWSTRDKKKYATLVVRDGVKKCKSFNNVSLQHLDGSYTHLTYDKGNWVEISKELILNIKFQNTVRYDYSEEHDLGIFTPKHDCVFKNVRLQRSCSCGRRTGDRDFWHGGKEKITRRVVTNYHFNMDREKYLSIFVEGGEVFHYRSPTGQYGWDQISNEMVLDLKKKDNTYRFYYAAYDQLPTYVGNYNFVFTAIVNGNEHIWQGEKGQYANLVYTDCSDQKEDPDNLAIVLTDETKILLQKSGGRWVKSDEFPGFDLDILEQYSTTTISYAQNTDATAHSFTTKNIFLIKRVLDECKEIWKAENKSQYARKVILFGDQLIIKPHLGQRIEYEKKDRKWVKKVLEQQN